MLFSETIRSFLLLYTYSLKQQVLLQQQQIFRTSNLVGSKQQLVLIFSDKQLELVNYKLKIPSSSTLMLIEQYIFLLSIIKIYRAAPTQNRCTESKSSCTWRLPFRTSGVSLSTSKFLIEEDEPNAVHRYSLKPANNHNTEMDNIQKQLFLAIRYLFITVPETSLEKTKFFHGVTLDSQLIKRINMCWYPIFK